MSKSKQENINKIRNKSVADDPGSEDKVGAKRAKPKSQDKSLPAAQAGDNEHPESTTKEVNTLADDHQNSFPETEMEVHHHSQLEHKSKPWKEYLLEGFMIFVAVFMGFIAENIREDISNSEHVKQLSSRLVQDLKADTTKLAEIYAKETLIIKNNDTLFNLLQQPLAKADLKRIQKFIAGSHSLWPFHPSVGAIVAIKNELHLKQFSNSEIISHISKYEGHIELLHTVQDITLQYQRSFLDPFLYQHFTPANLEAAFAQPASPNGQMRDLTQKDLTQLAAQMVLIRINSNELLDDNRMLKNDAADLLHYVRKQYHLEDE
ncbi:MAG TPA: hypothetical protein VGN20_28725 [Mucilaginibacter sp.]|jgi:hypothetical protein